MQQLFMNRKHAFGVVALGALLSVPSALCAQDYKLVWSDEFDSNTLYTNWNVEVTGSPSNNELQYYTNREDNVKIEDGNLVLTCKRENYGGRSFTSGRVNSQGKVYFTHGKVEASIKLPSLINGLWPAFWMLGEDINTKGWPYCGEIDIMEMGEVGGIRSGKQNSWMGGTIHWGDDYWSHQYYSDKSLHDVGYNIAGDGAYHKYTLVWDENYVKMYLDDAAEPYMTAAISKNIDSNVTSEPYMHKPYHILFNMAIGGDFPQIWDAAGITALPTEGSSEKMYVDYVRVYQLEKNIQYAENDAKEEGGDTGGGDTGGGDEKPKTEIDAAPVPTQAADMVKSIYSDSYTSVTPEAKIGWWNQSTVTTEVSLSGNNAYKNVNFNYLGIEFFSDATKTVDASDMEYLHLDVYPLTAFTMEVYPITKDAAGNTVDTYHADYQLTAGQWNQLDIPLSQFTAQNLSTLFQLKFVGGTGGEAFYLDNIYLYKTTPTAIHLTPNAAAESGDGLFYSLDGVCHGASSATLPQGLYIRNGKKIVVR